MKTPFLVGTQVYLRGLERRDLPSVARWLNDEAVTRLLIMGDRPALVERLEEQWEQEWRSPTEIVFAVCLKTNEKLVGTTGLYGIRWIMRSAEFRILLGEKAVWNRGVGTEVTKLLVVYAFDKLNLNRVWLGVNAENNAAVAAYEHAGFLREGVLRQEQYRNFRYYDAIRMGILREEYEKLRRHDLQPRRRTRSRRP